MKYLITLATLSLPLSLCTPLFGLKAADFVGTQGLLSDKNNAADVQISFAPGEMIIRSSDNGEPLKELDAGKYCVYTRESQLSQATLVINSGFTVVSNTGNDTAITWKGKFDEGALGGKDKAGSRNFLVYNCNKVVNFFSVKPLFKPVPVIDYFTAKEKAESEAAKKKESEKEKHEHKNVEKQDTVKTTEVETPAATNGTSTDSTTKGGKTESKETALEDAK